MSPQFSLVIPTRHRPAYVREALKAMREQSGDFEVILADNWVDPTLSARSVFDEVALQKAKYIRPPKPLGMVENWNFALEHAQGEMVLFFTDKNFLLPNALTRLARVVEEYPGELFNWSGDSFTPLNYRIPFGAGFYGPARLEPVLPCMHNSRDILKQKASGEKPRSQMSPIEYAYGKICFGAFHRDLITRILDRCGKLFFPLSPDYTSMVLGLSHTSQVIDVGFSGILQVNTMLSNGLLCSTDDSATRRYLEDIGQFNSVLERGIAPGLFTSVEANVALDFMEMNQRFDLGLKFERGPWLNQAWNDVNASGRVWSSPEVRDGQIRVVANALNDCGTEVDHLSGGINLVGDSRSVFQKFSSLEGIRSSRFLLRAAPTVLSILLKIGLLSNSKLRFHTDMWKAIWKEAKL